MESSDLPDERHGSGARASAISDEGSEAQTRRQRRKIQNRVNQRARRLRQQEKQPVNAQAVDMEPYRVHRWRLSYNRDEDALSTNVEPGIKHNQLDNASENAQSHPIPAPQSSPKPENHHGKTAADALTHKSQHQSSLAVYMDHFILADHLLHLIHQNVFRGLFFNKWTLGFHFITGCTEFANIRPKYVETAKATSIIKTSLPKSLVPTQLQMTQSHSPWIDVIPFPQMRDNLIKWENYFDHEESKADLVGALITLNECAPRDTASSLDVQTSSILYDGDEDEMTTGRRGLILWGEPCHTDSWEATPGFLRKWSWAVQGCEELIQTTNRWRNVRGEDPLKGVACI